MKYYLVRMPLCLIAATLTSCAGMKIPNAIKPNYILDAQGPLNAGFNPEVNSQITDFATAYNISRCKSSSLPTKANFVYETHELNNNRVKAKQELVTCNSVAIEANEVEAAIDMTKTGFDFMDSVCDAYFRRLGNQDQDLSFYGIGLNTVSAALTALLGTTEADAKSIAIVSSLFALGEAGLEGFDETYHFAAELNAVEELVYRAMDAYEQVIWAEQSPTDFSDAKTIIHGYQRICQTSSIRSLVTQAVKAAKIEPVSTTARDRLIRTNPSSEKINQLYSDISVTALTQSSFDWLIAGAMGVVPKTSETKLVALLKQSGIADPVSEFPKVRNWFDELSKTDYYAYQNILARMNELDITLLPADATSQNAARDEVIGSAPITPGTESKARVKSFVPQVVTR